VSSALLETLVKIAAEAAVIVQEVFETPFTVDFKGPQDPVTEADRRANDLICARLAAEFPGVPIVAEESAAESFAEFRKSSDIFFVDPVDGTNEFIERRKDFVVMIGLVQGNRATVGVMHAPALNVAWAGEVGAGATRIESTGARSPIQVSQRTEIAAARLVGSRSHRGPRLERILGALGVQEHIPMGSAGLKGAYVARGEAEAYVAPFYAGKRWDACAAEALVVAAGGRVTDAFGEAIDYRAESLSNDRGVVATNGFIHDALLTRIAEIRSTES
jgi:3'(2'), 5'-bisphosphate nucleotidase